MRHKVLVTDDFIAHKATAQYKEFPWMNAAVLFIFYKLNGTKCDCDAIYDFMIPWLYLYFGLAP